MCNILVTGGEGQLAKEIASIREDYYSWNFFIKNKKDLDILDLQGLESFVVENEIDVVINCAAYTNVEKAEEEKDLAYAVNAIGVRNVAEISKKHQVKLIHISTDYVFDGETSTVYSELDEPRPINVYGKTKLAGENFLKEVGPDNSIIIRTSWLYSSFGSNFVKTMLRLGEERFSLNVVSDQVGSPTYAKDLAKDILIILPKITNKEPQIYHYSNEGIVSWFDFAVAIMSITGKECQVVPVLSHEYKTKAKRPKYCILDSKKVRIQFGLKGMHWKISLEKCLNLILGFSK